MKKFKTKKDFREVKISTASLPDIVFLLLFFFMVTSTIKVTDEMVKAKIPDAQNITKAEKKILLKTLIVGKPNNPAYGESDLIYDGEKFIAMDQVVQWASEKRSELPDYYQDQMIVLIKADEGVKMGMIGDIQQRLRDANARKVIYRTLEESI